MLFRITLTSIIPHTEILLWSFDPIGTSWWFGTQSRIQRQFAFLDDVLAIDESTDSSQVVVVNGRLLAIVFSSLIYN